MWVLQIKEETTNEYDKFINHLNVGKEFDYSLILDMINLINVSESITNVEYIEKLIKEIQKNITSLNSNVTQLDSDVEQIDSNVELIGTNVNNLQSEINRVSNDVNVRSKIHVGEFNANDITEEGWYDSIVLGRPESSESDEKYFLYHSSNGGQVCFSRRNSGKAYQRLGVKKPDGITAYLWEPLSRDDYSLLRSVVMSLLPYSSSANILYNGWLGTTEHYDDHGYTVNNDLRLSEIYAGYWELLTSKMHLYQQVYLKPNDIIKLRCFYRWNDSGNKYNSDAYIYVSDSIEEGHEMSHLKSDFIKVRSLGSWKDNNLPNNLLDVRNNFFTDNDEYGWHYIKCNVNTPGYYYLHIAGNFTDTKSWFVIGEGEILTQNSTNVYNYVLKIHLSSLLDGPQIPYILTPNNSLTWILIDDVITAFNNVSAGQIVGHIKIKDIDNIYHECDLIVVSVGSSITFNTNGKLPNSVSILIFRPGVGTSLDHNELEIRNNSMTDILIVDLYMYRIPQNN